MPPTGCYYEFGWRHEILGLMSLLGYMMTWLNECCAIDELRAPFTVSNDIDYFPDLEKRFDFLYGHARESGADDGSLWVIASYKHAILESITKFYSADIVGCNNCIKSLIDDIGSNSPAVSLLKESIAFPGRRGDEVQLFRCRIGNTSECYTAKDMLHLPRSLRSKSTNCRFSIQGNPSFYLSNSSYGCWIETGFPQDSQFNVSPILLDGTQKIFNLAISARDFDRFDDSDTLSVHCLLKLYMLMIATSYRVCEPDRSFMSEYVISQSIMSACKRAGYDGVAYFSRRVPDASFALCAINLALFVEYDGEYSSLVREHMKIDDPLNFSFYKKLNESLKYRDYDLRVLASGLITNIADGHRQYPYQETEFYSFDKYLFASWHEKCSDLGKEQIPWGVLDL